MVLEIWWSGETKDHSNAFFKMLCEDCRYVRSSEKSKANSHDSITISSSYQTYKYLYFFASNT